MHRALVAEPTGVPIGGRPLDAVLIGASTGGPPAVERILSALPQDFSAPILICQHMPLGFTELWAERLDTACGLSVREARNGDALESGTALVAPIGRHLRFRRDEDGREVSVRLDKDFSDSLHVPSIDMMMSSAAQVLGSRALAVLLTGLGADGALGMLAVRRAGGHTIAEAAESAVAYSMPGSAVELGAALEEASIDEMGSLIARRVRGVV